MQNTTNIQVQEIDTMIQIDSGLYTEECNAIFGTDDIRTRKEIVADQIVDVAKYKLKEHQANKENYLNSAKYNTVDYIARITKYMNNISGLSNKAVHNTAAIEAVRDVYVSNSKRAKENWYINKEEDLSDAIDSAKEYQTQIYSELDIELGRQEESIFVDNRTKEQAYTSHTWQDMDYWTEDQLVFFLDNEEQSVLTWKAKWILIEIYAGKFHITCAKIRRLQSKLSNNNNYEEQLKLYNLSNWNVLSIDQQAEMYLSADPDAYEYFRLCELKKYYMYMLINEKDKVIDNKHKAMARTESKFWNTINNPDTVVAVEAGEKFWFTNENGEYINGACTDIKYITRSGETL